MTSVRASDLIGQRVKAIRDARGWSAEQLASRCAEIGAPEVTRSVIANIETGRRDTTGKRRREVTVDEMLTLAYALEVQPLVLFVPLSGDETLQVTTTTQLGVIDALAWVDGGAEAGVRFLAGQAAPKTDEDRERWRRIRASSRPLNLLRAFWLHLDLLRGRDASEARTRDGLEDIALDNPGATKSLQAIANLVDYLAGMDLAPPPLPKKIADYLRENDMLQVASPDELITSDREI
ncbi:MAG: helix-turn-helix domain-containing protein [Streptosporangiaceae bacterium]